MATGKHSVDNVGQKVLSSAALRTIKDFLEMRVSGEVKVGVRVGVRIGVRVGVMWD